MALPKVHRLRHRRDFDAVYRSGLRRHGCCITMRGLNLQRLNQVSDTAPLPANLLLAEQESTGLSEESSHSESSRSADASLKTAGQATHTKTTQAGQSLDQGLSNQGSQATRIGISISQKISKKAVIRNRIKRRIRAALRQLLPRLRPGWLLVIVVRPGAVQCEYHQFLRELEQLLIDIEVINGYP